MSLVAGLFKEHSMRAVIGTMGRIAGLSVRMRITIVGMRIRISEPSSVQIQENAVRSQLLAESFNHAERRNTQRRERPISTTLGTLVVPKTS